MIGRQELRSGTRSKVKALMMAAKDLSLKFTDKKDTGCQEDLTFFLVFDF